jgi:pimeloyl-ACP methyl ester carboxylesterase
MVPISEDQSALPSPEDLRPAARALYHGAVVSDHALRLGLASATTAMMIPGAVRRSGKDERRMLQFYADLTAARDTAQVFIAPPEELRITREAGVWAGAPGGRIDLLRFASPFLPLNPDIRGDYLRHVPNATARAQHWRHEDGPRPTLCVIHGFGASPAWFNTMFFSLREFFAEGWDIVLFTMPFHGGRRGPRAPFNGAEMFAGGYGQLNEAILQAICDLRVVLAYLRRRDAPRIGVTGLSLGGYTTAVLASVDPDLDFAIPNATVASMPDLIGGWFPANVGNAVLSRVKRIPSELLREALSVHSPLIYEPLLPRDRLMVVAGLGDRLTPPEHSLLLWEHWGRPELQWFPGSHILHFERGAYLGAMRRMMREPRGDAIAA